MDKDAVDSGTAVIGDFRISRLIASGDTGEIYEAEQVSTGRRVALKVLDSNLTISDEAALMLGREARGEGREAHPGIVAIHDVGEQDGVRYIAQELVEGERTLAHKLGALRQDGFQPPGYFRQAARLITEVTDTLQHAHSNGVVHGDLKPSNILLTDEDFPKVKDFGLRCVQESMNLTPSGGFAHRPHYVAPEQAADRAARPESRTDIYSLGVILFEMLTMRPPFEGETSSELLEKILRKDPPSPRDLNPNVPRDLSIIALKAMQKRPSDRYESMAHFDHDLRRYLSGDVILASLEERKGLSGKGFSRSRTKTFFVTLLLLVFIAVAAASSWYLSKKQSQGEVDRAKEAMEQAVVERDQSEKSAQGALVDKEAAEVEAKVARAERDEALTAARRAAGTADSAVGDANSAVEKRLAAEKNAAAALQAEADTRRKLDDQQKINTVLATILLALAPEREGAARDAGKILERASVLIDEVSSPDRPEIEASLRVPLGWMSVRLGFLDGARRHLEAALAISREISGRDHPDTLILMRDLADVLVEQQSLADAESLSRELLDACVRVHGEKHVVTFDAMKHLAGILVTRGSSAEAEELYLRILERADEAFANRWAVMHCVANLLVSQKRCAEAESFFRSSLDELRRNQGRGPPEVVVLTYALANALIRQNKFEAAEIQLLTGYSSLKKRFGSGDVRTGQAMNYLISLYDRWGKPEKAVEWRTRLAAASME